VSSFTRILIAIVLGAALVLPIIATRSSWGLGTETNPKIAALSSTCPPHLRDSMGNCKKHHRSVYGRRSYYGGGPRSGK
jgi:hypothetical protein